MWNLLTSAEIEQAKTALRQRRAATLARHAEEAKRLEADAADIEALDRLAAGFLRKFKPAAPLSGPPEADRPENAAPEGAAEETGDRVTVAAPVRTMEKAPAPAVLASAPPRTPPPDRRGHFDRRHVSEKRGLTGTNFDMFSRAVSKAL